MRTAALLAAAAALTAALPADAQPAPPALAGAEPEVERRSFGMMTSGIVLEATGGAAMVGGAVAYVYTGILRGIDDSGGKPSDGPYTEEVLSVVTIVAGAAMVVAGIPLLVVGAAKVPADSGRAATRPGLALGPRGVALRF